MIIRVSLFLFILFFALSCRPAKNISLKNNNLVSATFDLEGHRGCRGLMPENTIPAFLKAMEIGVTTLEMDAVITADEKVILSHEPFFNHEITTKANGDPVKESEEHDLNIFKMNYAQTQTYDVGLRAHPRFPAQQKIAVHKPLLSEVIDSVKAWCNQHNRPLPWFNIETKSKPSTDNMYHPEPPKFVDLLMKVITDHKIEDRVIIQSFDFRTLQYLHQHYPAIKTSALIEDYDHLELDGQVKKLGFEPDFYSPAWELVTAELVEQCHQKNVKLVPWTINDKPTMIHLIKMGVDGLISDYPDLFKTIQ
jgi:glycerophosphoryl diester phosphodiesterase